LKLRELSQKWAKNGALEVTHGAYLVIIELLGSEKGDL